LDLIVRRLFASIGAMPPGSIDTTLKVALNLA